jgi:cell division protein FtsB
MTNIAQALSRLREDRKHAQKQIEKLSQAITVLERLNTNGSYAGRPGRAKRVLSAAGRRRISLAQKARWAKLRQMKKAA